MDARLDAMRRDGFRSKGVRNTTTGGAPFTTLSNQGVIERITIASRGSPAVRVAENHRGQDIPTAIIATREDAGLGALEQFEAEPPSRV